MKIYDKDEELGDSLSARPLISESNASADDTKEHESKPANEEYPFQTQAFWILVWMAK
jgi:hypothetical protein